MNPTEELEKIIWFIHENQFPLSELEGRLYAAFIKQYAPKSEKILDVPCGWGRHHKVLREEGWEVYGLDINRYFIKRANSQFSGYYQVGDMRNLPYQDKAFDAVLNVGKSFGYFDELGNEECLREFYRVLREGGTLIMELPNLGGVRNEIKPIEAYKVKNYIYLIESEWEGKYLKGNRFIYQKDNNDNLRLTLKHKFKIRIYSKFELDEMATRVGFHSVAVFSGLGILPYRETSRRMLLIYKKSKI